MILAAGAAGTSAETFTELMDHVAQGFEALGAAILVGGVIWSFVLAAVAVRRSGWSARAYLVLRQAFGGTLLLGLEILVAADLIRTIAVAPTAAPHRCGAPCGACRSIGLPARSWRPSPSRRAVLVARALSLLAAAHGPQQDPRAGAQ